MEQSFPHPRSFVAVVLAFASVGASGPHDAGLLELIEPVQGVAPLALYSRSDEEGKTAVLVGHGDTRPAGGEWVRDGRPEPRPTSLMRSMRDVWCSVSTSRRPAPSRDEDSVSS